MKENDIDKLVKSGLLLYGVPRYLYQEIITIDPKAVIVIGEDESVYTAVVFSNHSSTKSIEGLIRRGK